MEIIARGAARETIRREMPDAEDRYRERGRARRWRRRRARLRSAGGRGTHACGHTGSGADARRRSHLRDGCRTMRGRGSGDLHECECGAERTESAAGSGMSQPALELDYRVYLRAMRT